MYKEFFQLAEYPFNVTADPKFLYSSRFHKEALSFLTYGIQMRKGFMALTGEVGAGKTTVCRTLAEKFEQTAKLAFIFNPNLSESEMIAAISDDLGTRPKRETKKAYFDALNRFLIEENALGRYVVIIIDEAQNLSLRSLEQIRLLSNIETTKAKLLQIVLAGQPELRDSLERPELSQLKQRLGVWYHLRPLERSDIERYVQHRLHMAGSNGRLRFQPEAIDLVFQYSHGVPRLINLLCDRALLAAFVANTFSVSEEIVGRAMAELNLSPRGISVEGAGQVSDKVLAGGPA